MITHNFLQNEPEWHEHRSTHRNASDSATVMGLSPYETRSEFMHRLYTGAEKEFSKFVEEKILADGHRVESLARPLAEKIIGEPLSPVTGSEGIWSASFDGIPFDQSIPWENKTMNAELRAVQVAAELPIHYRIQMEHQLMVSNAEKVLFTAYKFDADGIMEEELKIWYYPDLELRAKIIAAWDQWDKDFAAYTPPEVIPAVLAAPIMSLPALTVQVSGAITITDNLALFGEKLQSFVGGLNTKPEDDQGFADIESAVKVLQTAQDALEASEANALAQVASVDEMRRTVKLYIEMARDTRLMLDKVVKQRKEQIKMEFIARANDAHRQHIEGLEGEIVPIRLSVVNPHFAGAAKNKRNIASLRDALETALAGAKIEADAAAKDIRWKLAFYNGIEGNRPSDYGFLFSDLQSIIQKPHEDFKLLVQSRIAAHKAAAAAKLEADRASIGAEEQKKTEANHKSEMRAIIVDEVDRIAQRERLRSEEISAQITAESNAMIAEAAINEYEAEKVDLFLSAVNCKLETQEYKSPQRDELIAAIAFHYKVPDRMAAEWLIKAFQREA